MKSGWSSYCRKCANAKSLQWKRENHERQLANTKAWKEENKSKVKEYRKNQSVLEKERKAAREWRSNNLERARENDKKYRANNPEKMKAKDMSRQKRLACLSDGTVTGEAIKAQLIDQEGLCAYCKCQLPESGYHVDHLYPVARGGMHSKENIVIACKSCNLKKGAKEPMEFMDSVEPTKITKNEARRQSELVIWTHKKVVRDAIPALKWLHHSPGGEKRDKITGNKLKAMGVKPGFPDLILPARGVDPTIPGLAIEMKSDTGRLSTEQAEWRDHFIEQGWAWHLVREVEEGKAIILAYFGIPNDPAA